MYVNVSEDSDGEKWWSNGSVKVYLHWFKTISAIPSRPGKLLYLHFSNAKKTSWILILIFERSIKSAI